MRADFAKQLTERERVGHADHFGNYRHLAKLDFGETDEVGGRERMRLRYDVGFERKSFNENLNPLRGWLRSCVGKAWDKCYSELRSQFDARKVVNAHILEHLFQYVEINAYVNEAGKVVCLKNYGGAENRETPIAQTLSDFYVCPKTKTLKAVKKQSRSSLKKQRLDAKVKAEAAVTRLIDEKNVLHLVEGVWFHFTLAKMPVGSVEYAKPDKAGPFPTGRNGLVMKEWEELNEEERRRFGKRHLKGEVLDVLAGKKVWRGAGAGMKEWYHATKKAASHKVLKQAGLAYQ